MGNRISAANARRKRNKDRVSEKNGEIQVNSITSSDNGSSQVSNATYWLPNHNDELDRLSSQHFALKILFEGNVLKQVLDKVDMDNAVVLDVGCGPGTWLMDMATDYPGGQFYGIDLYNIFPHNIRPANVNFQCHDAMEGLPFPDNTFDLVNMRMLFVALKKHEWPSVYSEIYRVLKPGGFIQACECTTIEMGNEFTQTVANAFRQNMIDREQDPYISSVLDEILKGLNYKIIDFERKQLFFGNTDALSKDFLWNIVKICQNAQPLLEESFGYSGDEYQAFLVKFEQELKKKPNGAWSFYRCTGQK